MAYACGKFVWSMETAEERTRDHWSSLSEGIANTVVTIKALIKRS